MEYLIKMRCVVIKQLIVESDSIEEVENNPYDHLIDEVELEQIDWDILDIRENK